MTFEAPGPGEWQLEAGHRGRRPLTAFLGAAHCRAFERGNEQLLARYGLPLAGVRAVLVNGCEYVRPYGIGEGNRPKPAPPLPVLKLLVRLHPELRRRNRAAVNAWRDKRWRSEVDEWFDRERSAAIERNLSLQRVDLVHGSDEELVSHIADLLAHYETALTNLMVNHGGDLMPVGDYLSHATGWGIGVDHASALLRGSSPATIETTRLLAPAARAIAAAVSMPTSVDMVRALDPTARDAVDGWLERHGHRLLTSDDIDRAMLSERPALQLATLLALAATPAIDQSPPDPMPIREQVPTDHRSLFDDLLTEARYGLRQRDDKVGICLNWPAGLIRRAVLEAGARLTHKGLIQHPEHAVELAPDEVGPLLFSGTGPTASQLAERASWRDEIERAVPPSRLGSPETPPPLTPCRRPWLERPPPCSLLCPPNRPSRFVAPGSALGSTKAGPAWRPP